MKNVYRSLKTLSFIYQDIYSNYTYAKITQHLMSKELQKNEEKHVTLAHRIN